MTVRIRIDYRFDATGFFADPARRTALEAAADAWEAVIADDFDPVPAGVAFTIDNPSDRTLRERITLADPLEDVLVFVGAADLPPDMPGLGAPDGMDAAGDILAARVSPDFRGTGPVTDFEPWAGSITFDSTADWSFDPDSPVAGRLDFVSAAVHEIGHVLGLGTAEIFRQTGAGGAFSGANALAANGGQPVPLTPDLAHVAEGVADDSVAMGAVLAPGERRLPGAIDRAMLADIGYEVPGLAAQGATPPIATAGDDGTVFGTLAADLIAALGGDDQPQGDAGDDTLLGGAGDDALFGQAGADSLSGGAGDDQLLGGPGADILRGGPGTDTYFGDAGTDLFEIHAGDGAAVIADFDPGTEVIRLVDAGLFDAADALARITKPFANVSELVLPDGTSLRVFHAAQIGTPLTASNFQLAGTLAPVLSLAPLAADRGEGDGGETAFTFAVTRSGDPAVAVGAAYQVAGSGPDPAAGGDFAGGVLPSGTVSLAPGETDTTITVQVSGDTAVEPDEGFTLALSDPFGGAGLGTAAASGIIRNDDQPPAPVLSIAPLAAEAEEGDTGTTAFTFIVTRGGDAAPAVGVRFAVAGTGAVPADPADFAGPGLPQGTLTLAAGETARSVAVEVAGDTAVEGVETFAVTLSDPSGGAKLGQASAEGRILNDDSPPPPTPPDGVLRGTDRADVLTVAAGATYLGGGGEDVYLVSPAVAPGETSVIEDTGPGTLQLVDGLAIFLARIAPEALELTLTNGAVVRVLEAGSVTFSVGGNATTGQVGTLMSFGAFVRDVLDAAVPEEGIVGGGSAVIGASAAREMPEQGGGLAGSDVMPFLVLAGESVGPAPPEPGRELPVDAAIPGGAAQLPGAWEGEDLF